MLLLTISKSIEGVNFGKTLLIHTHYPNALYTCKWKRPHCVEWSFKLDGMLNFGKNFRGLKKNLIKYEKLSAALKNLSQYEPAARHKTIVQKIKWMSMAVCHHGYKINKIIYISQ